MIVTLGDAVVDVIVELSRPLEADDDIPATTTLQTGGQAANVAAWVVEAGGAARVLTRVGDDSWGSVVRDGLARRGVELCAPDRPGRTGTVVSLVGADGSRTMASDRGDAADLRPDDLRAGWFTGCRWLHISGYVLLAEVPSATAVAAAGLATAAGARVSADLSSATLVDRLGAAQVQRRLVDVGAALVFANRSEAASLGALDVEQFVVKRGAMGATVRSGGRQHDVAAEAVADVRDTTGAGDAFAAGWLVGGPGLAARSAARCVRTPGAMPPLGREI